MYWVRVEDVELPAATDGPGRQGEHRVSLRGRFQEHVGQQRQCSQVRVHQFCILLEGFLRVRLVNKDT